MPATRRPLDFRSYDALLADVARLREVGYDRAGNWELPQIVAHLAHTMDVVSDPATKPMPRPVQWAARTLVLPRFLKRRAMPTGMPTPGMLRAARPASDEAAFALFVAAVDRARAHLGPTLRHPAMGRMAVDDWHQLQLIHAAHHLSFLVPRAG